MRHRLEILAKNTCLLKLAAQSLATNYAKYFKPFPKYLQRNPKIEESTFILFHILTSRLSGFSIEWIIRHLLKNLSHQSLSTIFIIIFLFSTRIQNFFLFSKWYGNWNTKARASSSLLQNISCKNSKGSPYLHFSRYCGNCHKKNKNWRWLKSLKEAILSLGTLPVWKLGQSLDSWRCYRIYPSSRNIVFPPIFPIYTSFFVVVFNSPIPSRGLVSKQPISIA